MKDRRVAPGIWRTKSGWRLYAWVNGKLRPKRIHDPQHRIGLVDLKQRRTDHQTDARRAAQIVDAHAPAGFASDVRARYLPAVAAMPTIAQRTRHMELWIAEFGDRPRNEIEPWEIRRVRDRWLTVGPRRVCVPWPADEKPPGRSVAGKWIDIEAPLSASQVNSRLRALENFYSVMNGRHGKNPAREAGEAVERDTIPRALGYDVIEAILAAMPDRGPGLKGKKRSSVSLAKLRLRVIAYTGLSHGELMAIRAEDLRLHENPPAVIVHGRQKGKGTRSVSHPLTPEGRDAFQALLDADGLGPFSRDSVRHAFRRACAKLNLRGLTPYQLRHSFATEMLEKTGGNVSLTQLLMRHRDPRTTLRYAQGAVDPAKAEAIRLVTLKGAFKPATPQNYTGTIPSPQRRRRTTARSQRGNRSRRAG